MGTTTGMGMSTTTTNMAMTTTTTTPTVATTMATTTTTPTAATTTRTTLSRVCARTGIQPLAAYTPASKGSWSICLSAWRAINGLLRVGRVKDKPAYASARFASAPRWRWWPRPARMALLVLSCFR